MSAMMASTTAPTRTLASNLAAARATACGSIPPGAKRDDARLGASIEHLVDQRGVCADRLGEPLARYSGGRRAAQCEGQQLHASGHGRGRGMPALIGAAPDRQCGHHLAVALSCRGQLALGLGGECLGTRLGADVLSRTSVRRRSRSRGDRCASACQTTPTWVAFGPLGPACAT